MVTVMQMVTVIQSQAISTNFTHAIDWQTVACLFGMCQRPLYAVQSRQSFFRQAARTNTVSKLMNGDAIKKSKIPRDICAC